MESPRALKRRRLSTSAELITPPSQDIEDPLGVTNKLSDVMLDHATNVLLTEATALSNIAQLYKTNVDARASLKQAVTAIIKSQNAGGKLVTCGVGKSAYIAQKLTATCKSLGITAGFMHACEAVHGDLGDLRNNDILLFVSYSGKTPELLNLLPHLPVAMRTMAITSQMHPDDCALLEHKDSVLLPAPIPQSEHATFGISAPTTSTTVALAVSDMLALTAAQEMHGDNKDAVFKRNHPGGAIGISEREAKKRKRKGEDLVALELPSPCISGSDDA
jgi:D-arabinose 5-phosphate isomerase GutQ